MGPRDTSSNAAHDDKKHSSEREDDDDVVDLTSPARAVSVAVSPEHDASVFYKERQARAAVHNKNHGCKQIRSRKRWLGTLTILSCFIAVFIIVRFQTFSIDTSSATKSKPAILTFDSWQDVTTKSSAAYALSPLDRDMLQQDEELPDVVATKRPAHTLTQKKKRKKKFATLKFNRRSSYLIPSPSKDTTVWDVDGPPVSLPDGETLKNRSTVESLATSRRRGPGVDSTRQRQQQQVQAAENMETTPPKTPGITLHASEALQCRDSVINFVINATDGKDECDGLIKAFDKTCSNDEQSEQGRRRHLEQRQDQRKRTRRLWDKLNIPYALRLRVLFYRTMHGLKRWSRYLPRLLGSTDASSPFFFAEDEVFKAWNKAQYLVDTSLDGVIQSDARRSMYKGQCVLHEKEEKERRKRPKRQLEEIVALDGDESTATHQPLPPATNKTKTTPTGNSLQLPIKSQQHVSDKFANDALLLHQGDKIIKAAEESAVAKEEAAKSIKSISDTADAVSAVLNDPNAVEARTCCASILNVYHELCSTDDEEQVSDSRLFFLVFVMACCGMVKSLIRHFRILWLPEAAGCIIVGGKYRSPAFCTLIATMDVVLMLLVLRSSCCSVEWLRFRHVSASRCEL